MSVTGIHKVVEILQTREWNVRLRLSDFRDLEDEDNRDAPLSNIGQPSHFDRIDTPTMETTAAYYRRIGELAHKLPYRLDREIAEAIAEGQGYRRIKVKLRVGQSRIERVKTMLERWLPESFWGEQQAC